MNAEASRKTINNGERHLPLELVENILVRQTVEDLLRCRSICKPWKTLIDSYRFQNNFFEAAKRSISTLFIWRNSIEPTLHLCYPHSDHNLSFELALNLGQFLDDSVFDSSDMMISSYSGVNYLCFAKFGVVNGLVYVCWNLFHVIWNPCTKQFNRFCGPKKNWQLDLLVECGFSDEVLLNREICAFGFDPISGDYMFLMAYFACVMSNAPNVKSKVLCQLYSMRNKCWKEFIVDFPRVDGIVTGDGYLDDGKFHWFAKKCGTSATPAVITFDFHNEVFERMSLPEELAQGEAAVAVANRGALEVIMTFGNAGGGVEDMRGEVWAVGNDGEWRKTLTVKLPSNVGRPVGLLKEGEMMFESPSHIAGFKELLIFNPATSLRKNLGFVGTNLLVFKYVRSLFSVKL